MPATQADPSELTADELRAVLEDEAQHYLGMSADEFIAAAHRGELPDHPVVAHLVLLAGAGAC
jgi:hypothetical protein